MAFYYTDVLTWFWVNLISKSDLESTSYVLTTNYES